jgi:hypothetical protein
MQYAIRYAALAAIVLAAACAARITHHEPTGDAEESGLSRRNNTPPPPKLDPYTVARAWLQEHPGKCGVACFDAWAGTCSDFDLCSNHDAERDDLIACGSGVYLTCWAAREATSGEPGLENCTRICEELRRP